MPYDPPPELQDLSLADIAGLVATRKLPPVEQWTPAHQSDSHMRIAADGRWYHQGGLISRPAMVRLFASVLRREADGRYALVTPFEQQWIEVEDAPFIITGSVSALTLLSACLLDRRVPRPQKPASSSAAIEAPVPGALHTRPRQLSGTL